MKKLMITVAFATAAGSASAATDLVPLSEILKRPSDEIETGYPFVRCSALYDGLIGYGGKNLQADTLKKLETIRAKFQVTAVLLRSNHAKELGYPVVPFAEFSQRVLDESFSIAKIYIDRQWENYRATGQSIGGDELISGDMQACNDLIIVVNSTLDQVKSN